MTRDEALHVLGLPPDATRKQILCAYRELAQMLHPDKFAQNKALYQRAEQQMRSLNTARDLLLKGEKSSRHIHTPVAGDDPEAIMRTAQARAHAAESARLMVVEQLRTMTERRSTMMAVACGALVVMLVCSRLKGTLGALGFSIASMATVWGAVDVVSLTGHIQACKTRVKELIHTRNTATNIAREAEELLR